MLSSSHFTANCREQALAAIFQNIEVYYPIDDAIDIVAERLENEDLPSSPPETIAEKTSPKRDECYPLWMD